MSKYQSFGITGILVGALLLGCAQNPVKTTDTGGNGTPTTGFNISGTVLGKDGKGIAGARATLLGTGLTAVTDANGTYKIQGSGTLQKSLAKSAATTSDSTDTLVVLVPNEQGSSDSSEVIKQVVTSGIIMELPSTYIVQREIRGYLLPDDAKAISRIEAVLFDVAVPEQQKHIDLWHDTLNKAFHSFAYFSSATNKSYTLYVNVYDTTSHLVGRSPDFTFPDQAGNIVFANAFSWSNAKPTIEVIAPVAVATGTDSVSITVRATDSLGGKIVSCKIYTNATNSITVQRNGALAKRASNDSVDVFVGTVKIPVASVKFDSSKGVPGAVAVVIDNDGNILQGDIIVTEVERQIDLYLEVMGSGNGIPLSAGAVVMEGDRLNLGCDLSIYPETPFTVTKVTWFLGSTVIDSSLIGSTVINGLVVGKYVFPNIPAGKCTLSVKVETDLGTSTTSTKVLNVVHVVHPDVVPVPVDTHTVVPVVPVVHPVVPAGSKPIMEQNGLTFTCTNVSVFAPVSKAVYIIGFGAPVTFDINSPVTIVVPANTPAGTKVYFHVYISSSESFYSEYPL